MADVEAETAAQRPAATSSLNRLLQSSSLYLLGNVAGRIVGFLAIPFYAHFLDPAQYGLLELIELSTQTVAIVFGLQAVGTALSRVFHDQDTLETEQTVVSTALMGTAVLSGLVALLMMIFAAQLSQALFHTPQWAMLLRAAFLGMFFGDMIEVVLVYERIRDHARFFLAFSMITLAVNLGLNILFIGVFKFGVWGFVSSKLVVTVLSCLYLAVRVRRDVGFRWRSRYIPEFVRIGAPLIVSALAYFAIHFSDRFFLSSSVSLADLGRYSLAYKFAFLVSAVVGDSFAKTWGVTLYRYVGQPDWQRRFAQVGTYFGYALFASGLAVMLFSPEVLRIMVPADYLPPPLLLPLLIVAYVIREIGDFFRSLLLINKRVFTVGKIAVAGAAVNLVANALLIPRYGTIGAGWATLVTWALYGVVCWAVANREHKLPISRRAFLGTGVLMLAVFAAAYATRVPLLPLQIVLDGVWLAVFCGAALLVLLSAPERRAALGMVGSVSLWLIEGRDGLTLVGPTAEPGPPIVLLLAHDGVPGAAADDARLRGMVEGLCQAGLPVRVIAAAGYMGATEPDVAVLPRRRAAPPAGHVGWATRARLRAAVRALELTQWLALPHEDGLGWLPGAFDHAVRTVEPGSVVLSTQPPAANHLTALALKHRTGTPWIADLGGARGVRARRFAWRARLLGPALERLVLEQADTVLTADETSAAALRTRHPAHAAKIHAVAVGPDLADRLRCLVAQLQIGARPHG